MFRQETVHLRSRTIWRATVDTLRVRYFAWPSWQALKMNAKGGLPPVARSGSGERRVVDQTGIEPVTS